MQERRNQGYKCATKGNIRRDTKERATTTETTEEDSMFNQKEQEEKHNTRATRETHMQQGQ
jgi:hypothetical protein